MRPPGLLPPPPSRAPQLHCAPPLIISEEELRDGWARAGRALEMFDSINV